MQQTMLMFNLFEKKLKFFFEIASVLQLLSQLPQHQVVGERCAKELKRNIFCISIFSSTSSKHIDELL